MQRLKLWGCLWAAFMVLIVFPAFLCAPAIEGEDFLTSMDLTAGTLQGFYFPRFLAMVLMAPVTVVAKLVPVASAWVLVAGVVLAGGFLVIPMIVFAMLFGAAEMPYYRKKKAAIDPDWYHTENQDVVVKATYGSYPFARFMAFMIIVSLTGVFWVMPSIRLPIADNWVGEVYSADARGRLTPLNVTLELSVLDPGMITDRKPLVKGPNLHLEFSGSGVDQLKALGINDNFIKGRNTERTYYPAQLCRIEKARAQTNRLGYAIGFPVMIKNYWLTTVDNTTVNLSTNDLGCPTVMHFGISSFNEAQLAINGPTNDRYLVANLTRNSRWNWIEKKMVQSKFVENPDAALEHRALGAAFGY